ncbi:MAG TPA: GNAT family N-acetyltransferase [Kofleriaceae bacterium]|nr:GNAT family N-acetyltransferase [Kofleriaceae bacterium]
MTVREATMADAPAIARVQVESWHSAYRELMPARRLAAFTIPVRTVAWRHNLRERSGMRTTVFDDGRVRGFASIGRSRDLPGWGEIWAIYVEPGAWGRGIGSALFADAMPALAARGLDRVMLWVLEGNQRALQFYQGNGFVLDGKRKVEDDLPQLRLVRAR